MVAISPPCALPRATRTRRIEAIRLVLRASLLAVLMWPTMVGCQGAAGADDTGPAAPPPAGVAVGKVRGGAIAVSYTLLGDVRARQSADLAAGVSGEVVSVPVREGDRVEKGDVLFVVEADLARSRLSAAEEARAATAAELAQARQEATRRRNAGAEVVAAVEIEQAEARAQALASREAQLQAVAQEARQQLRRHRVTAPFAGVVSRRSLDPGDWVDPGTPALRLVDDENVDIVVDAQADLARYVDTGTHAEARHGAQSVPVVVRGVVRALDPVTRTLRIRLEPESRPPWLLAGAPVDVVFEVEREEEGAVVVPRDALVTGAAGSRVVRVVDDKAQPVQVEVVATAAEEVLVRGDGLAANQTVVTRGNERLRPDQPVKVLE